MRKSKPKLVVGLIGERISMRPDYQPNKEASEFRFGRLSYRMPVKSVKVAGEYSIDYFKTAFKRASKEVRGEWRALKKKDDSRIQVLLEELKRLGISPYGYIKFVIANTPRNRRITQYLFKPEMLRLYAETIGYPEGDRLGRNFVVIEEYLDTWRNYLLKRLTPTATRKVLKWMGGDYGFSE